MNFWTTGRIDEKVDFEIFQPPMLEVENRINEAIKDKDYGDEIASYDIIANIFVNKIHERYRYSLKTKETDIDVNLDHDEFIAADFNRRCTMYINGILYSIDKMRGHRKLKKFNFDLFYQDVSALLNKYVV